jgi:hypothetical protein
LISIFRHVSIGIEEDHNLLKSPALKIFIIDKTDDFGLFFDNFQSPINTPVSKNSSAVPPTFLGTPVYRIIKVQKTAA